jgi:tetratricopeptide (TPR) repeat protein
LTTLLKYLITASLIFMASSSLSADTVTKADSIEVMTQYSLFSEYYKNKDYESALPFGWKVIELNPTMLRKWIYDRMEDVLWYQHDSADVSQEEIQAIEDTIEYFYNTAIENYPEEKAYYQSRKAFVFEAWLNRPAEEVIAEYEKAIEYNPELSTYYYNRLGLLYISKAEDDDEFKQKAIEVYTYLSEREPENAQWPSVLENLVDSIDELVDLSKRAWELDKDNLAKAYKYGGLAFRAERYDEAVEAFRFLTTKNPDNVNYWNQLANIYQKTNNINGTEEVFKKLMQLEPDNRNNYLNLGIIYKDKGQLTQARNYFLKASEVNGGWGLPIYYEGLLYEQAARNCGEFNFESKLVYQVAVNTYRRALQIEPSLTQARDRINALQNSIPTQEDFFFRGHKSGQSLPVTGSCYGWIGKNVTVP